MTKSETSVRVSIIIPVYNEAQYLDACLTAIATQTVAPYEVIVVDNNSSDATVAVAERFPFVAVLHQPRQGVVHARRLGFNRARGTILGRIDADSQIAPDWVETVQRIFEDSAVDAVSGSIHYYDIPTPKLSGKADLFFRQRIADRLGDEVFLYGANMAIRRSVWRRVRGALCESSGLHEDFDLAIHAESMGASVVFDKRLHAGVSLRRFEGGIREFLRYALLSPATYARHNRTSQRHMYSVIVIVVSMYWFIWACHQLYDQETEAVSLRHFISGAANARVNPATFVE